LTAFRDSACARCYVVVWNAGAAGSKLHGNRALNMEARMSAHPTRRAAHASSPVILACVAALRVATPSAAQRVDESALTRAAPQEWLTYGRDYAETHYSPLSQINTSNVSRLAVAWTWNIPKTGARLEAVPVISDGVMYATGPWSFVFALDARTGRELWRWDPAIPDRSRGGPSACCGEVNRGVAVYGDRVFVGLLDGRLVALDRKTGNSIGPC
jgi:alcohol dehydrogenase (cytochrome c)/quinohemoprotein ethanol dehydrogenase